MPDAQRDDETRLFFTVTGSTLDPDEITRITGLQPAKIWHIGDTIGKGGRKYKENGWKLDSGLERSKSLDDHLAALLAKIEPVLAALSKLDASYYKELACVIEAYCANPGMHFDRNMITLLAQLGAEIDIDLYCLGGAE
jgi:hypothetical protein